MIVKVCGIKTQTNYSAVSELEIDMIGLNFYPHSKRFVGEKLIDDILTQKQRVGVFVNETLEKVLKMAKLHDLDYIQLHGNESPSYCQTLKEKHRIIMVFSIETETDLQKTKEYNFCDYFLFDTKTPLYGGSGKKFDWKILDAYTDNVGFLIAGGIGPQDFKMINDIDHPQFKGIDINSKFEDAPGLKNIEMIKQFLKDIKHD